MTKSILKQIFNGELYPSEQISITDPEYLKTLRKLGETKEKFNNSLSDKDKEIFEEIGDLDCHIDSMYSYECFAEGVRIGVALAMETSQRRSKDDKRIS
jgi:hypothetical protein